ncbi:MAG: type III-B CRISPR-associated protein Cas10/Cmr2 [Bacteroidota bacterium]
MTHYYGLTLGPIYDTLSKVRATRELWGASYLFSDLMRRILEAIAKTDGIKILLPAMDEQDARKKTGVGIYPDRMIAQGSNADGEKIQQAIQAAISKLGTSIAKDLKESEASVISFLQAYLQTYLVRMPVADILGNPVDAINELLDAAELRPTFQQKETDSFLADYLDNINQSNLKQEAFATSRRTSVPSLIEISTTELGTKVVPEACQTQYEAEVQDWFNQQQHLLRQKREAKKSGSETQMKAYRNQRKQRKELLERFQKNDTIQPHLKDYHKYIAVVYADGDNIGATLGELENSAEDYQEFSQQLLDFGIAASESIQEFGGLPVYVGGDDLLFFAPLKNGTKTLFHLAQELDELFKAKVQATHDTKKPSLSFGVCLSYHKFPMYEALGKASELLFKQAKRFPWKEVALDDPEKNHSPKNMLAFQLLKHSGQELGQAVRLTPALDADGKPMAHLYQIFLDMLDRQEQASEEGEKQRQLLSSVAYVIKKHEVLLDQVGGDSSRLSNFFAQQFNESVHQQKEVKEYLELAQQLVLAAYQNTNKYFKNAPPSDLTLQVDSAGEYARQT